MGRRRYDRPNIFGLIPRKYVFYTWAFILWNVIGIGIYTLPGGEDSEMGAFLKERQDGTSEKKILIKGFHIHVVDEKKD